MLGWGIWSVGGGLAEWWGGLVVGVVVGVVAVVVYRLFLVEECIALNIRLYGLGLVFLGRDGVEMR